ncbi:hypothetical protein PMAYCL1PPCAC_07649, partial [Pristionchus mayeri]
EERISIKRNKKATVHCVQKICSLCSNLENVQCDLCEDANHTSVTKDCKFATCPDDKWRLPNDELYKGKIECRNNSNSNTGRESAWYTQEGRQITHASCAKPVNCWRYNNHSLECPSQRRCGDFDYNSERTKLNCPNGQLKWYHTHKYTVSIGNVTCSLITGKFTDDAERTIEENSKVLFLQKLFLRQPLPCQPKLPSLWARQLALQWAELSSPSFSLSSSSLLLDVFIRRDKKI